jgi:hypothetical protein
VEVCGKAVNRGGGLGMEIPCVYRFDGPEMHVSLLEKLVDIPSNPAIRKEMSPEKNGETGGSSGKRKRSACSREKSSSKASKR